MKVECSYKLTISRHHGRLNRDVDSVRKSVVDKLKEYRGVLVNPLCLKGGYKVEYLT